MQEKTKRELIEYLDSREDSDFNKAARMMIESAGDDNIKIEKDDVKTPADRLMYTFMLSIDRYEAERSGKDIPPLDIPEIDDLSKTILKILPNSNENDEFGLRVGDILKRASEILKEKVTYNKLRARLDKLVYEGKVIRRNEYGLSFWSRLPFQKDRQDIRRKDMTW